MKLMGASKNFRFSRVSIGSIGVVCGYRGMWGQYWGMVQGFKKNQDLLLGVPKARHSSLLGFIWRLSILLEVTMS